MKAPRLCSLLLISAAVPAGACPQEKTAAPAATPPGAAAAVNQPIHAELQALQGTWEGIMVGDRGTSKKPDFQEAGRRKPDEIDLDFLKTEVSKSPPEPHEKITVTVTGNSLHFHRDASFWFETTITLPAGKEPKQLHATIKRGSNSIGEVVRAFFRIEDGTLTLATMGDDSEETPKGFEAAVGNRYELRKVQPQQRVSGSGLDSLVLEGHELHASLKTGPIDDDSVRHVKRAPGNPHVSTNADFVTGIARGASQGSLGREGVRSVLYALYREKNDLGFYGLEAVPVADADRWEEALRKIWSVMGGIGHAQVHRAGLVIVVIWNDGVSPECWKAVNAKVVERLSAP